MLRRSKCRCNGGFPRGEIIGEFAAKSLEKSTEHAHFCLFLFYKRNEANSFVTKK